MKRSTRRKKQKEKKQTKVDTLSASGLPGWTWFETDKTIHGNVIVIGSRGGGLKDGKQEPRAGAEGASDLGAVTSAASLALLVSPLSAEP